MTITINRPDDLPPPVACPVDGMKKVEDWIKQYHDGDEVQKQLTLDLEAGRQIDQRALLSEEMKEAEQCLQNKFTAMGVDYGLSSGLRPKAYQAHFFELRQKWSDLRSKSMSPAEVQACIVRRDEIAKAVGWPIDDKSETCPGVPGGRNHCIDDNVVDPEKTKHNDGNAVDVSSVHVDALTARLTELDPPPTIQQYLDAAPSCNLKHGISFNPPDPVHFGLKNSEQIHMELMQWLMALGMAATPNSGDEDNAVHVQVYGEHKNNEVVYHYTVINNHDEISVDEFIVGFDAENGKYTHPTMRVYPVGGYLGENEGVRLPDGQFYLAYPDDSVSQPDGWRRFNSGDIMDSHAFAIGFDLPYEKIQAGYQPIKKGDELGGFSIRTTRIDPGYFNSNFIVRKRGDDYIRPMEKLDTTPPVLNVTIEPKELWAPNGKPVEVTVTIDVEDDYDGQPAVELVSITVNEELSEDDIVDADIGSDDRSFKLAAKRSGKNKNGRVYTITYRASDALGNQSEAITTVTVGHDRRR